MIHSDADVFYHTFYKCWATLMISGKKGPAAASHWPERQILLLEIDATRPDLYDKLETAAIKIQRAEL